MRYRTALFFLIALITCWVVSPLYGQDTDALYPMQKKTKWGFINAQGEWEIEPQHPQVLSFSEGLAAARTAGENQWGFLNKQGKWAIAPEFGQKRSAYRTYGGERFYSAPLDPFSGEYAPAMVDGELAYINKKGETVKRFPEYSVLRSFHEGLAVFAKDEDKGYINKKWSPVIEPEYEEAGDFHEGLAYVSEGFGNPYGYVNKEGDLVIEAQYEEAGRFSEGRAPVRAGSFDPYGYINTDGEWAIEPQFKEATPFSEGLAFVVTEEEEKKYYMDKNGEPKITSPIEGYKLCHGHPFRKGLALVSLVRDGEDCGRVSRVGSFPKALNSVYAYVNKSGEIVYRQSFENGRYLKQVNDSIQAAERREEKRREKAEARRERKQLEKCADFKAFGDTTASSYLEIGYKGVNRRFYYSNDVFEKTDGETFKYHIPAFQQEGGNAFLALRTITLEPSFINEDQLEAQDLGYRFSYGGENECIHFPSDATENGSVTNVTKNGQSSLWKRGKIKYTDPENSKNYFLINAVPDQYRTPNKTAKGESSVGGFIMVDDERLTLSEEDNVEFKYYPRQKKLEISIRARQKQDDGVRIYSEGVSIEKFEGSTGTYFDDPVHRFDDHYVEYYRVRAYSDKEVHVKHYRKALSEDGDVNNEDLSFSTKYLVGEYKGRSVVTAVDSEPVVFQLSN